MTTNFQKPLPAFNKNKTNEHPLDIFSSIIDGDWTRAIHHELNIKRRTCNTFVRSEEALLDSKDKNDPRCGCKRYRREHSWDVIDGDGSKWDKKKHTISAYNNAYGYIPHTHAHYIRCDIETNPRLLARLMFEVWQVKKPRLIMCIIGGAKYFKLNERLEREFIKGIIQAALKADGWIVTSGFKTGVVQLVGEAIHDHKVTNPRSNIIAIGCSKWGAAKNRESLILTKSSTNRNLNPAKNEKGQQDLEPNHTHFLLLDDGTYYGYDIGDYRTRFVTEVSCYDRHRDAPIVTIVVEGGPDTLSTIYNDLRSNIPVVLIDGSGRVPNLLASFLNRTESMINRSGKGEKSDDWKQVVDIDNIEKLKTKFRPYVDEIRDGLKEISKGGKTSDKDIDGLLNYFLYCLQPAVRSKIKIYSLDSSHDLDDTIFEAIIEVKQKESSRVDRKQLLELALAWDAIDIAKEHIIKDDLNDLDAKVKQQLFFLALILDRPQFVNTFIKLNFDLPRMFYEPQTNKPWKLIWNNLSELYNNKNNNDKNKEHRSLLDKCHENGMNSVQELDEVLRELIGDYMKSIYTRLPRGPMGRLQICFRCPQGVRVEDSRALLYTRYEDGADESEVPDPEEAEKEVRELVYRDLFFWSILTNRIEMSKVILSHMQSRTCAALIASKILKSYVKYANDNESKDNLRSQAKQFEDYACECLKQCYYYDEDKACEIAIRRINLFGGVTCLQVAVDADDKDFVGLPCCDQLLGNIWYNKIDSLRINTLRRARLLLSICTFGLLAPFIIEFREKPSESKRSDNAQRNDYEMTVNETEAEKKELLPRTAQRLDSHGINYCDTYTAQSDYCSTGCFNYFRRLKQFHESPIVKFSYTSVGYIFFLLLFSYYLLFDFNRPTNDIPSIHWTEILVTIILTTMLIEDVRQFLCQENRSIFGKFSNYFVNNLFYNSIRAASYALFYVGLILRFTYAADDVQLSAAKIVLAYDLEIWFIRSLSFLGVAQNMGPKLVMIRRMLVDLSFFIYIILTAMIAYGITSRSMFNFNPPNNTDDLTFDGRSVFRHTLYPSYYLMYGGPSNELLALDADKDSATAIATQVLLAFHMLFVNILLINLLIAMFSYTFYAVQVQTDLVWRYERYSLVREYFDRPPFFPPLIIIMHFIELIKLIARHFPKRKHTHKKRAKAFKMIGAHRDIDRGWSEFESYATNRYARSQISGQPALVSALEPLAARQEDQQTNLDLINFPPLPSNFDAKALSDEMSSIKRAVGDLRTYAEEMNRCMRWMMDAMERVKMSKEPKPKLRSSVTTDDLRLTEE